MQYVNELLLDTVTVGTTITVASAVAVLLGISLLVILKMSLKQEVELEKFKKTFLYRQGTWKGPRKRFNYKVFSPNGGRDWYAIDEYDAILGKANDVYPGLIGRLETLTTTSFVRW